MMWKKGTSLVKELRHGPESIHLILYRITNSENGSHSIVRSYKFRLKEIDLLFMLQFLFALPHFRLFVSHSIEIIFKAPKITLPNKTDGIVCYLLSYLILKKIHNNMYQNGYERWKEQWKNMIARSSHCITCLDYLSLSLSLFYFSLSFWVDQSNFVFSYNTIYHSINTKTEEIKNWIYLFERKNSFFRNFL